MLLQEFVNHGMLWLLICEPYYCNNVLSFYFVVWLNCFTCPTVGGVLFKIYIIGETIKVVRRFSLPNVSKRELAKVVGVFRFPRVSSAAASADDADLDPGIAGEVVDPVSVCVPQNIYLQPSCSIGWLWLSCCRTSSPPSAGKACKGTPPSAGKYSSILFSLVCATWRQLCNISCSCFS